MPDVSNYGWVSQKSLDIDISEIVARSAKQPKNRFGCSSIQWYNLKVISNRLDRKWFDMGLNRSNQSDNFGKRLDKSGVNLIEGNGWINPKTVG